MTNTMVTFEIPIAEAQQITEEQRRRQEFIMGLVAIAKFFNDNPHLMVPTWMQEITCFPNDEAESKRLLPLFAKAMGSAKKVYGDTTFSLEKTFGDRLKLQFMAYRDQVCERIVVGKETVPAHIVPEKHVPEHVVEKVEWRCSSILADKSTYALESGEELNEISF